MFPKEKKPKIKTKLRLKDEVVVIAGKDKGKSGKILSFVSDGSRIVVEGVNMVKKHVKRDPQQKNSGGIIEKEGSIHVSNVMFYENSKATRLGYKLENGVKERYSKNSGKSLKMKEGK